MSILVVGATGLVGGQVAQKLRKQGQSVRALVRGGDAHPKVQPLRAAGIEIVAGDLTVPETLDLACRKIATVVTTATSMPTGANDGLRRVDLDGTMALIEAAERAGVKRFVYTSYSGNIHIDSPLETAKRTCENRLLRSSMQTVILRPTYFTEVWLSPALGFDFVSGAIRIYGSGEAKGSYISAFDVADFAVAAAVGKDDEHTILEMGGPQPLSQLDAVKIFEQALEKKFQLQHVPAEALQQQYSSPDPLQKTFGALMLGYAKGDEVKGAQDTAKKYGIRLTSVGDYASRVRGESAGSAA
jgi:NADH dehydrogenase